jgi:heme oxygenase
MQGKDTVRSAIRSATAGHHERVDRVFSGADLTDRNAYGRFLSAQAEAHVATEEALTLAGAASILPDWPQRQRASLLRADLAALGLPQPAADAAIEFAGPSAVLGGIYVLEGSRLGGRVLRRGVPSEYPCSFLDAADTGGWRRLLAILEDRLADEVERDAAIDAAIQVFNLFERSGTRHLAD